MYTCIYIYTGNIYFKGRVALGRHELARCLLGSSHLHVLVCASHGCKEEKKNVGMLSCTNSLVAFAKQPQACIK